MRKLAAEGPEGSRVQRVYARVYGYFRFTSCEIRFLVEYGKYPKIYIFFTPTVCMYLYNVYMYLCHVSFRIMIRTVLLQIFYYEASLHNKIFAIVEVHSF